MPEAVDSNSTRAPKRQRGKPDGIPPLYDEPYFQKLPPYVEKDYQAVVEMIQAYGVMVQTVIENGDDFSLYANGIHKIHRLILLRLDALVSDLDKLIDSMADGQFLKGKSLTDLLQRVGRIVAAAYAETGIEVDVEQLFKRGDGKPDDYTFTTTKYFRELVAKLEGDNHLLTVGSLLPWLEMKIWREVAGIDVSQERHQDKEPSADENASHEKPDVADRAGSQKTDLRDRLIAEQAQAGVSLSAISQAFNIKRVAVERILGRLTAEDDGDRIAV